MSQAWASGEESAGIDIDVGIGMDRNYDEIEAEMDQHHSHNMDMDVLLHLVQKWKVCCNHGDNEDVAEEAEDDSEMVQLEDDVDVADDKVGLAYILRDFL